MMFLNQLRFAVPMGAVLASPLAFSATNNFVVPEFRGLSDSGVGYWEVMTVPYGAPGNAPDQPGSNLDAILTQTKSPSAFATGSGNLYDPVAETAFEISGTSPFQLGTVVLQVRTLGSEIAYEGVSLSYEGGESALTPLYRWELDRGAELGASVSSLWQWDLRGLNISDFTISFASDGSSMSLDSVTVDTWSDFVQVPEPSSVALLAVGLAMLAIRRRS